jgi:ankyrin repeat protein
MPNEMLELILPNLCPNPSPVISRHLRQMIHYLCVVMPVHQDINVTETLKKIFGGERDATIEFLKLAVYLLSNKLLRIRGSRMVFCDQLLKWFQTKRNYLFLRKILSHNSPTIEAFAEDIFSSALHDEDAAILRVFLEAGISPEMIVYDRLDLVHYRPLQVVTRRGNFHLIEMFVDMGADINATNVDIYRSNLANQTPLQLAARRGDIEVVKYLMHKGATVVLPEVYGPSALQNAAMAGNLEIASLLIDNGADINASYGSYGCALACAILVEANSIMELLLQRGPSINCDPGYNRYTPLECAAKVGNRQIVDRLLKLGADANLSTSRCYGNWRTALQWAVLNGDLEMCHTLMQAGADVNALGARNDKEQPALALICAVKAKNHELAALLIERGANVNRTHPLTPHISTCSQ